MDLVITFPSLVFQNDGFNGNAGAIGIELLQWTVAVASLGVLGWGLVMLRGSDEADARSSAVAGPSAAASPVELATLDYARIDLADVPALTRTFLSYNKSISLSPENGLSSKRPPATVDIKHCRSTPVLCRGHESTTSPRW